MQLMLVYVVTSEAVVYANYRLGLYQLAGSQGESVGSNFVKSNSLQGNIPNIM